MNQRQAQFIADAMRKLTQAIEACADSEQAEFTLGRKQIGKHTVKVTLVAERDAGFSAPLQSHASSGYGDRGTAPVHTEHRNRSQR